MVVSMQVLVEDVSKILKKLTCVMPNDVFLKSYNSSAALMVKTKSMPGFRKGKVPLSYLKQHCAEEIEGKAINSLIKDTLHLALQESNLQPVSTPELISYTVNPELSYVVSFEVMPKIEKVNFSFPQNEQIELVELAASDLENILDVFREKCVELNLNSEKVLTDIMADQEDGADPVEYLKSFFFDYLQYEVQYINALALSNKVCSYLIKQNKDEFPGLPDVLIKNSIRAICKSHGKHNHNPLYETYMLSRAITNIYLDMLFQFLADQHKLTVSQETLDYHLEKLSAMQYISKDTKDLTNWIAELKNTLLRDEIVKYLLKDVDFDKKFISYQEYQAKRKGYEDTEADEDQLDDNHDDLDACEDEH